MRAIRALLVGTALIIALSACEMTVRFTTVLDERGGGTFSLGMLIDADVRQSLDLLAQFTGNPADGISSITELFDALEAVGWDVTRSAPSGGLAFEASSSFADPDDFGRLLGELGSARAGGGGTLGGTALQLGVGADATFMRSATSFEGLVDLTLPQGLLDQDDAALVEQLRSGLRFEVRTEFPGAVGEIEGIAVTENGTAIWRPALGERTTFAATSSNLRAGNLLMLLVPSLLALGALGWILIGRRKPHDDGDGVDLRVIREARAVIDEAERALDGVEFSSNGRGPRVEIDLAEEPIDAPSSSDPPSSIDLTEEPSDPQG